MSNSLGEAVLDLTADRSKLDNTLNDTKKGVEGTMGKIKGAFSAFVGSAILSTIVKSYNQVVAAAEEALVTEAKVAGVLRATGNVAGYTVGQLSDMADEFSRLTGVDDELILNAEAVLLTFRQVGREVFPEATQAALDMSAVMDQDLQGSIVMIGKALNDPIAGLTALRKVGVTFNDEQEKMIRDLVASNDLLGAQGIILEELQAEFGGTAEEMEKASAGGKKMNVSWGNLMEAVGKGLVPQQRELNESLADTFDWLAANVEAENNYRNAVRESAEQLGYEGEAFNILQGFTTKHSEEIIRNAQELQKWSAYGAAWEERLAAETVAVGGLDTALENLDFKGLLDLTMSLSDETAKFNEQQDAVREKQAEIKAEIDTLIAQGWSPLSEKVSDLQTKYDDLGLRYDENAIKHKAATDKILYDLFIQKLSVDGLTNAEYEMGLQAGLALGQIDENAIDTANNFNAVAQAVTDGRLKVEDMQTALDMLPSLKNIDVVIDVLQRFSTVGLINQGVPDTVAKRHGYAEGTDGWLTVPGGYQDDSYVIGLTSGEHFAVAPNVADIAMAAPAVAENGGMALKSNGGTVVPVQFIYQPFIGVNDEYEAKNKLRSIVSDLNREAQRK